MNSIEYLLKSEFDMKLESNEKELEATSYFSFVLIRQIHSLYCAYWFSSYRVSNSIVDISLWLHEYLTWDIYC